jgi:hypothetical protein
MCVFKETKGKSMAKFDLIFFNEAREFLIGSNENTSVYDKIPLSIKYEITK